MHATDVERPLESAQADVTLVTRGITLQAHVRSSGAELLVLEPDNAAYARNMAARPGDRVELFWRAGHEERALPAEVAEVEVEEESLTWHVRPTGPAERSKRRAVVRATVRLPVRLTYAETPLIGETIDLSEEGVRAQLEGWGLPPDVGALATVALTVDEDLVVVHGEIVRVERHGAWWTVSVHFRDVTDVAGDRLRKRVFRALREERARSGG